MEIKTNGFKMPNGDIHTFIPPSPTETERGGIKAKAKTTETIQVAVDTDGFAYVPDSPVDNTLTKTGQAADAKTVSDELNKKLNKNLGVVNAIRTKKGAVNKIYPKDMATEISEISTGTDTSDATATTSDILSGKTAYAKGTKITETMPVVGTQIREISNKNDNLNINSGYHNGNGYTVISDLEKNKIIPQNIKKGVNILGVYGTHEGNNGVNTSDATAVADNILYGKTAYVNGGKVAGTMPDKSNAGTVFISNANVITKIPRGYYDGNVRVDIDSNSYRNLHSDNIREGITILGVTGTMKASQSGARVMSGTTTSQNIVTGLNKIDYFFLYTDKIYSLGVVSLSFNQAKNECSLTFCGDYSVYSKYCNTVIKKPFIVSGGDIVWTESMKEYCFMSGVAYNWVAIGS